MNLKIHKRPDTGSLEFQLDDQRLPIEPEDPKLLERKRKRSNFDNWKVDNEDIFELLCTNREMGKILLRKQKISNELWITIMAISENNRKKRLNSR